MRKHLAKIFLLLLVLMLVSAVVSAATVTIRPDGAGFRKGWGNVGCSSGSSEWQCVDEVTLDTSDYLKTTGTKKETFTFGSSGLTDEDINSVTMHYQAMQHNNNKNRCFEAMTRSGGTDYLAGTQMCVGTSWEEVSHTYTTNPATGSAWTVSEVEALEAGMKGLNPDGGGRVAQVWAVVDYDAPFCGDNETNGNETCDGTDLNGESCSSQGFDGGTLACAVACDAYDTSGCFTNTCSDTDGGFVVDTQGTVSGDLSGSPYSFTDTCSNSTFITEWVCTTSDTPSSTFVDCLALNFTGCSNGACF